jgi:hypothetical protein
MVMNDIEVTSGFPPGFDDNHIRRREIEVLLGEK